MSAMATVNCPHRHGCVYRARGMCCMSWTALLTTHAPTSQDSRLAKTKLGARPSTQARHPCVTGPAALIHAAVPIGCSPRRWRFASLRRSAEGFGQLVMVNRTGQPRTSEDHSCRCNGCRGAESCCCSGSHEPDTTARAIDADGIGAGKRSLRRCCSLRRCVNSGRWPATSRSRDGDPA